MDENDKPDGSTAMERLCRELMERGVRPLWCPGCGRRYGWPAYEVSARDGEAE